MQRSSFLCVIGVASLMAQVSNSDARAILNRGVAAFKGGQYTDAVIAFQEAVRLAPGDVNPRLYLGTAYMSQWIPGGTAPGNEELAVKAEDSFQQALNLDSRNTVALASLASLAFNQGKGTLSSARMRHFDEAERWYQKLLDVQPEDKTALYSLGVIAWERYYPELMNARAKLGMKPETPGPLPNPALRADLRARFGRIVEDGIACLKRAIELDPQYDDAMAYLNLLYRERADYSDSAADYRQDVQRADEMVTRALEAKGRKGEVGTSATSMPPPPPSPSGTLRIRVGGAVQAQKLLIKTTPVYPPLAKQARVQGTVRFSVIIDRDGRMANLQLVSGHPLLVPAATEAVKNWAYEPTLLNGQPVEVITQVDVNFTLVN